MCASTSGRFFTYLAGFIQRRRKSDVEPCLVYCRVPLSGSPKIRPYPPSPFLCAHGASRILLHFRRVLLLARDLHTRFREPGSKSPCPGKSRPAFAPLRLTFSRVFRLKKKGREWGCKVQGNGRVQRAAMLLNAETHPLVAVEINPT